LKKVFLDYTQDELDAQYEQRAWVPHADAIIARYAAASDAVRTRLGQPEIHSYGPTPAQTLDVYGGGKKKAFVFVHGGAWKRQSSRENAFAAQAIVNAGATYVALNFALLPSVTMSEMVGQVCRGIEWIHENLAKEIFLCGHSSGGHLAACALTKIPFVKKALVVSGLYDLLPVRLSARNDYLRLDERLEDEFSPIRHVDRIRCPVTVAWAEKESAEFARQSREFSSVLKKANKSVKTLEGGNLNHFEIIETMADPHSPLGRAALTMLQ
jgi:arylformamidase